MLSTKKYNVVIIGGGITGTSLLYVLSKYTDIPSIALIEKYDDVANVNSHYNNNSQTLHFGDIETNYSLHKAKKVKEAASMLVKYLEANAHDAYTKNSKMVLAVGSNEVQELETRFEEFKESYPKLKKISREEISVIEPNVVKERDEKEPIMALYTEDGYSVDFKQLSKSFVKEANKSKKGIDVFFNSKVKTIIKENDIFLIETENAIIKSDAVAVMAGPHSLVFAKDMGYGSEFGILPVAGSFYWANNVLKGKVYTVQNPKLPFAAVHGDPNVRNHSETRFGPTAKVIPVLERHHYKTVVDFLRVSVWSIQGVQSLLKIISDKTIFLYILNNLAYDIPFFGKWLFLKNARKIAPSVKYSDLHYCNGVGGVRPQVINTITKKMEMGEAEIVGDRILFNITPSPGASVALKNAELDALKIIGFLQTYKFDYEKWRSDFMS